MEHTHAIPACAILGTGVAAIFGPASDVSAAHMQAICDALEIPHIETRWEYRLTRDPYSVNLYPHPLSLSRVRAATFFYCYCHPMTLRRNSHMYLAFNVSLTNPVLVNESRDNYWYLQIFSLVLNLTRYDTLFTLTNSFRCLFALGVH